MTYFQILLTFILPPLLALVVFTFARRLMAEYPAERDPSWRPYLVLGIHVFLALAYTTPWDNYLVANRVWWYEASRVSGLRLGWVPLEEYLFFILQTLLTGLWTLALLRIPRLDTSPKASALPPGRLRNLATLGLTLAWLVSLAILAGGWQEGRYLGLILIWALPALISQAGFGADLLWGHRRLIALAVLLPSAYLWLVDAYAIHTGAWTIDPSQSTGLGLHVFPGSLLPMEEMLFFTLTNLIVACGMTLMLSPEAQRRFHVWRASLAPGRLRRDSVRSG